MTVADLWNLFPLLILALGALLVLLVGAVSPGRWVSVTGIAVLVGAALWSVQEPLMVQGPVTGYAATLLGRLFTQFFCLLAVGTLLISIRYNEQRAMKGEEFPATILFTTMGMVALAGATNFLVLFLGLEAMTFGFYILVAFDLNRSGSAEAGMKYLLMGAVSAAFLAFGIALLYASSGSLDLVSALRGIEGTPLVLAGWGCILIGLAFKLSLVPAHLWTPDVYQGAPAPVVAFLSGGSKGASVLVLLMMLSTAGDLSFLALPLKVLSLLSMVVGNLAALLQTRVKRMLAYSSIAQMGYIVLALLCGSGEGYRAAGFYAVVYGVISLAAFGAVTVLENQGYGDLIESYQGAGRNSPIAAFVLGLALFSLAGIPPTAGFTGKFLIFAAAIKAGELALAVVGILSAAAAAYYYLRLVARMYLGPVPDEVGRENVSWALPVLIASVVVMLLLGLYPPILLDYFTTIFP